MHFVLLSFALCVGLSHGLHSSLQMSVGSKKVLIVGGTRFSGLYLWKELVQRGHEVTLYNRGKTAISKLPCESDEDFAQRSKLTKFIKGNRQSAEEMKEKLGSQSFDVIYDMNGRESGDTAPLADMFNGKVEHFIYMSSAGVYKKSPMMPHIEGDTEDVKSRHKGKLETESYLRQIGIPFTSIRPTYIYGPMNYNPLEEYFFASLSEGRRVCIPGHGQHITGLGHVADLATAMAQVIGRDQAKGQVYNIQDTQSVSFEGLTKLCAQAMGSDFDATKLDIKFYDPKMFDFGDKKAFPMRGQHFFCSVDKAMRDLDWAPKFNMLDGLKDSYLNDFKIKKAAGAFNNFDFSCDDLVLKDDRVAVVSYNGMPKDDLK
mmetsp:Transcript_10240/g.14067  ORF Transcript_10240/g.14067 Transcript_10240/m.14067 type:complete len:373 (+) Transcript_10240:9059-10177(+)